MAVIFLLHNAGNAPTIAHRLAPPLLDPRTYGIRVNGFRNKGTL
jgi:hypothetical protein